MLPLRHESTGFVQSPMDQVFAHIDDHTRLSSHMGDPSWRTGGGRFETQIDEGRGQIVGSRIRLSGRVFGVELSVEEIVVERDPPRRKVWETTGVPRLLVIGHYRMGLELSAYESGSLLGVFIEYALPERGAGAGMWMAVHSSSAAATVRPGPVHSWSIATHIRDVSPDEMQAAIGTMGGCSDAVPQS